MIACAFTIFSLSGPAFYIFARKITSSGIACILSIFYMALPYHSWIEIYYRNAITELGAYIWIPLLFYYLQCAHEKKPLSFIGVSIAYGLLIVTHLPSALFTSLYIGIYGLYLLLKIPEKQDRVSFGMRFCISILLGIGLAGFYFYPALSLLQYTKHDHLWADVRDYHYSFLPFLHGNFEGMHNFTVTAIVQALIPFLLYFDIRDALDKQTKKDVKFLIGLSLFCLFMMSFLSAPLWSVLIPLQKIQFPWRMLVISDFLYAAILCYFLSPAALSAKKGKLKQTMFPILIGLQLFIMVFISMNVASSSPIPLNQIQKFLDEKITMPEHIPNNPNMTVTLETSDNDMDTPLWTVVSGQANIRLLQHKPRLISLKVDAQTPMVLEFRQFNFYAWRVKKDGLDITQDAHLRDSPPMGQATVDLPAGQYQLDLSMDITIQEKIGYAISSLSLIFLCAWFIVLRRKNL